MAGILAEIFQARPEDMIQSKMVERTWREEREWPAAFSLGLILGRILESARPGGGLQGAVLSCRNLSILSSAPGMQCAWLNWLSELQKAPILAEIFQLRPVGIGRAIWSLGGRGGPVCERL